MRKTIIILSLIWLILLNGCNLEKKEATFRMCINESGTNNLSYDTLEGCKLLTCLIDNHAYDGLVYSDRIVACRIVILQEK